MMDVLASTLGLDLDAARSVFRTRLDWPSPTTGFAYQVFDQVGMAKPDLMAEPLRTTSAGLLRRTPELAAFGYVIDRLDTETAQLWLDAVEHLRGREIYPADRQSFIFNPIEILGLATGLRNVLLSADEHRDWFANTVLRGFRSGQFRSPLSSMAAAAAYALVHGSKPSPLTLDELDLASLGSSELILAAGIDLGFGPSAMVNRDHLERTLLRRVLTERVPINDAAEAASTIVALNRFVDRMTITGSEVGPVDRIATLCRRFPLFVEQLQTRKRERPPFEIKDEYDVQDLLHAILKLHFDDVRPEEYTPSFGGNASRVDFLLPRERIVVEAKMTRPNLGQKEVTDQLINDVARYAAMTGVDSLVCLVYDPTRRCRTPSTVEHDVEKAANRLAVKVVICPQGL